MRFQTKLFSVFIPIFLFLLVFSLPDKASSQIGCCQNPGANCVPSKSNDGSGTPPQNSNQTECELGQGNTEFEWFAGEICVPGNDCPGFIATGCCVIGVNNCIDDQDVTQCDGSGGMLEQDTACADIPECNVPPPGEGCCVAGDNDCLDDQTSLQCPVPPNVEWLEEVACSAVPQCNIPPPGTGCCVIEMDNCVDDSTEEECPIPPNADWVEDTDCDFVPACNVPPPGEGCCVVGDNNCLNNQTEEECPIPPNVEWVEDVACSSVPQCDIPPPGLGCCVLGENDCINDQNEDECDAAGGNLELRLSCSSVPECNVMPPPPVVSNVPTISQWGMIAMAGLLGIFSLLIIMRRKKYSLN